MFDREQRNSFVDDNQTQTRDDIHISINLLNPRYVLIQRELNSLVLSDLFQ